MRIITAIFLVLVPSMATKEYADDISQLLKDPQLIYDLVKRLGSDGDISSSPQKKSYSDKHSDSTTHEGTDINHDLVNNEDKPSCKTRTSEKTIIRTEDSRLAGAIFLGSSENIATNEECVSKCCSSKGCELAVYENKTKHNCYLFTCRDAVSGENKCKFDIHADYVSTRISSSDEDTLKSLDTLDSGHHVEPDPDSLAGRQKEKVTEPTIPLHTEVKSTPRPTQLPHSVALGGSCLADLSCEDPHAVCSSTGFCKCQNSYNEKSGFCREVCGPDQAECKIRGTSWVGPDCIPKSKLCDGTTECADGSDERDCSHSDYHDGNRPQDMVPSQDMTDEQVTSSQDSVKSNNLPADTEDKSTQQGGKSTDAASHSSEAKTDTAVSTNMVKAEKKPVSKDKDDQHVSNDSQSNKDTQKTDSKMRPTESEEKFRDDKTQPPTKSDTAMKTTAGPSVKPAAGPIVKPAAGPIVKPAATPEQHPHVNVVSNEGETVFLTKEKVIVASPTDNAQGPIVALSLGLAITVILLVFVGCRLRNVRRRLRKGRPLHSNEADYLINGMYL